MSEFHKSVTKQPDGYGYVLKIAVEPDQSFSLASAKLRLEIAKKAFKEAREVFTELTEEQFQCADIPGIAEYSYHFFFSSDQVKPCNACPSGWELVT